MQKQSFGHHGIKFINLFKQLIPLKFLFYD